METITIVKEFNQFSYFDGIEEIGSFFFGKELWLASSDYNINKNVCISILRNDEVIRFGIFSNIHKSKVKRLSSFQPHKVGFDILHLNEISQKLNLKISEMDSEGNQKLYIGSEISEVFNVVYQMQNNSEYLLVVSIGGGRGPEYIYVYKCFEVKLSENFRKLYFID